MAGFMFCLLKLEGLLEHEEIDTAALRALTAEIVRDGMLREPVIVDGGSLVILDGHHRVSALRSLGCDLVPAYLVDYLDPRIVVHPRRPDLRVTKNDVVKAGRMHRPFPPKTSRHEFATQPEARPVSLEALRQRAAWPNSEQSAV
jgi:L-serine kinase (ADP)